MAEYALFKPTSSDEESEELNCIYEKLRRRRQPAIRKPQQADDSSMSSSDDTSMSPNSKGGDDFSTSLSDESGQQQLNSRHWKVAQTTCRTTTPSTRSMRDLKHPSSAKTVGANDLFPSVDNTVSHSDAVCKPTAAPSYALDEDTFDADLAALEVPPAKASCRDSIDSLRPLNAESHRFDEEESFPDITEAELAAIDINEIQQTALCIHVRSAPSPSPPPDVVDDASIHKQVQRDPEVSPLTKRKNDNQSSPTIRPTVVHDNFLRLQQAHRVEATTCLNLNQTKVFSKTSLDSAVYDDSIDEASLAVIDITVKESVPINERKSSTDDDHYKTLDKQDPATADRPAVNAMDQEIFADDTFANLNEATIAAIEDIDGKNQRDQNPVGLQGRVWLTKSATAHKKPCPDTFNKNSIVTNATTSNPYQISRRPPQSKEKTCRSAMPNEDLAFTVETSSTPVAQASGAAHCCVYEYQPVGEDWIFEEGDHRKHAESFFTEADLNVRNVDAFGFEIEATPDQAAGGQEASQHRGILKRSIVSSTKGEDFEFDLKEPYRHTFQETKDSIRAKYSDRAQHLCDDRSSENVNFDEAFGFDEQMIPTRRDVHKADEDVHERTSEIDPTLCAPMPCDITQEPIVHHFTARNRPVNSRRLIPVAEVFESPVKEMWKTKFETFNQLQSEIANMLAYSDDNVVVSAPTGAGKTAIFEMAIARFVALDLRAAIPGQGTKPQISKRRKIVYVSPSKALCEERFEDWSKRLSEMNLGIEIVVVTGDGDPSESFHDLASAHFILTTPEKWDSLTRRWTDNFFLMASVKLFLVDEVHLIADESRGCCLEAIVCRMKTIQSAASRVEVTQTVISQSRYG